MTCFLAILLGFTPLILQQEPSVTHVEIQPRVEAVFPSSDTLPANLLRMYVHFSSPMRPMGNLEKIRLLDESGQEVVGALFNNVYELWNHEQTQLTLLFDPSRVKTGLQSHKERGRAMVAGRKYTLKIGALEDVNGQKTSAFAKDFVVTAADLNAPNIGLWDIIAPKAGTLAPLIIRFPEKLDRLSLLQRLKLTNAENQPIAGKVKIIQNETEWHFHPEDNWTKGSLLLYVHSRLEDPSGNNLNGLFDHSKGSLKNEHEGVIESINITLKE